MLPKRLPLLLEFRGEFILVFPAINGRSVHADVPGDLRIAKSLQQQEDRVFLLLCELIVEAEDAIIVVWRIFFGRCTVMHFVARFSLSATIWIET
jgi:hypothetical protein